MQGIAEAMDVQWGLQHVREIQLTVGDTVRDTMDSLLDVRCTVVV